MPAPTIIRSPLVMHWPPFSLGDLSTELWSLGLAFNIFIVKTQNLTNEVNICLKNHFWMLKSRNYTQIYASFGAGSNTKFIRSHYRCCCINEPVIFSHCVHLKLGRWFHALLKVRFDCEDIVPLTLLLFRHFSSLLSFWPSWTIPDNTFNQSKTVDSFWPVNVLTTRKVWQCLTFKCTR